MKLIVGLGNPTMQYAGTRHNVGFSAILDMADQYNIGLTEKKHKAIYGIGRIAGEKVILAMPQTYMNLSGESVRELMDYYKLGTEDLVVIYDDIDLDLGKLRIREKGSAGGHNGIKNIIAHTGTQEFTRIRVGVGAKPKQMDLADYVLSRFTKEEQPVIRDAVRTAAKAVEVMISQDVMAAMNQFN